MNKRYELLDLDEQLDPSPENFGYIAVLEVFTPAGPMLYAVDSVETLEDGTLAGVRHLTKDKVNTVVIFPGEAFYVLTPRNLFRALTEADLFERSQLAIGLQHQFENWHKATYQKGDHDGYSGA